MFVIFIILLSIIVLMGVPFWYDLNGLLFKNIINHEVVGGPDWHFALVYLSYFFALGFTLFIVHRLSYRWVTHPFIKVLTVLLCLFCWTSTISLVYIDKTKSTVTTKVDLKLGDDEVTYYIEEPDNNGGKLTFSLDEIAKTIFPSETGELVLDRVDTYSKNEVKWLWQFPVTKGERKMKTSYNLYIPPTTGDGENVVMTEEEILLLQAQD